MAIPTRSTTDHTLTWDDARPGDRVITEHRSFTVTERYDGALVADEVPLHIWERYGAALARTR